MYAPPPLLNLVVIRSRDLKKSEEFYQVLGLTFEVHKHGNGAEHLAGGPYQHGPLLEIYPLRDQELPTTSVRIGFNIDGVDSYIEELINAGGKIINEPHDSPWGRRAVVQDPDGHKVELVRPENRTKMINGKD